jgi:hypothetical protein
MLQQPSWILQSKSAPPAAEMRFAYTHVLNCWHPCGANGAAGIWGLADHSQGTGWQAASAKQQAGYLWDCAPVRRVSSRRTQRFQIKSRRCPKPSHGARDNSTRSLGLVGGEFRRRFGRCARQFGQRQVGDPARRVGDSGNAYAGRLSGFRAGLTPRRDHHFTDRTKSGYLWILCKAEIGTSVGKPHWRLP